MTIEESVGALCMQLARTYTRAGCNLHPVTLTFHPFDPAKGCMRDQLRSVVVQWIGLIGPFMARHGHAIRIGERDILAMGHIQDAVSAWPSSTGLTASLVLLLPGPLLASEAFVTLAHARNEELLGACSQIRDQWVGDALDNDAIVGCALWGPLADAQVTVSDLILATPDMI